MDVEEDEFRANLDLSEEIILWLQVKGEREIKRERERERRERPNFSFGELGKTRGNEKEICLMMK
jgi:hypothetical protein